MKKHLVTLHCGQQIMATSPSQRFCNRKCAGYFVTRRPGAKKRNQQTGETVKINTSFVAVDSNDPLWNSARRYTTKRGYVLLSVYLPDLKINVSRMEHIVVWEKCHGESVPKGWVIHHRNEQTDDNDPVNLLALPRGLHKELHFQLQQMRDVCSVFDYLKRRHKLTKEYIRRSIELTELRRDWYGA